jgi:hypothetical protein
MRVLLEDGLPLKGFTYGSVESLCQQHFLWDGKGWRLDEEEED